jgi:regulator of protease activity HflC (stomatin/prohibitin superfamily)
MLILIGILFVVLVILGFSTIKIVKQSTVGMVENLGKFNRQINAGFNIVIPFIERVSTYVDLRTQVLDSDPQPVITKDNVGMSIDTVTYYRITDAFKSVYEIQDLENAILNITATTLRDVIGGLELDETYTSRDQINARLRKELDEATDAWGVKIDRVEVKNINPPADIRAAMEKQMRAEREKRAQILEAEGHKESAIRQAEGQKQAQILNAEADKEAQIRRAEGEAQAIERVAIAQKEQIGLIYGALKEANLDDKILAYQSIKALEKIAESDNKILVPYEATALMGSFSSIKDMISENKK